MLALNHAHAKVNGFTPRAERHGDEIVPAGSMKFTATVSNLILDELSKGLRKDLYRKASSGEQQDLIEGQDALNAVKHPRISFSLDDEFPGYELVIHSGLGLSDPIAVSDVTVKKLELECLEGGSVELTFSCAFHPTSEDAGLLCSLIQNEVEISLAPPTKKAEAQQDLSV